MDVGGSWLLLVVSLWLLPWRVGFGWAVDGPRLCMSALVGAVPVTVALVLRGCCFEYRSALCVTRS